VRLIHVIVSRVGFRNPASNPDRWALLDQFLALAARLGARLLVLPGGFLAALDRTEMLRFINEVGQRADRAGFAVLGGIDLDWHESKRTRTDDAAVQNRLLPFYGFAAGPLMIRQPASHPWRQTSTTNGNAWLIADEDVRAMERVVVVDELAIAVLICGELFSERARNAVSGLGVELAADLGHSGMGNGLIPAMTRVALYGHCAVAHAQHVVATTRSLHFVDREGGQHSAPAAANGLLRQEDLWAGWAVRDL